MGEEKLNKAHHTPPELRQTETRPVAEIIQLETAETMNHELLADELQSTFALAEALACTKVEHPRVVLVKRLSDLLLLSTDQVMPSERALIDEILVRLIVHVDVTLRKRIARRISGMTEPPGALLAKLARDEIIVAESILENNLAISDSDLIDIVRKGNGEHRRVIASRKAISSSVADALVEMSEVSVLETLLRNECVHFSLSGMEKLAQRSRYVPSLQPLIVERAALHSTLAYTIFWWLPSDLRLRVLFRFSVSRRVLQQAIADAVEQGEFDLRSNDPLEQEALHFILGGQYSARGQAAHVFEHLKTGKTDEFLSSFSIAAGISRQTVVKILRDPGGEALAVLCKAVSLKRQEFVMLARLLEKAKQATDLTEERAECLELVFDSLPTDSADLILRHWDKPRLQGLAAPTSND